VQSQRNLPAIFSNPQIRTDQNGQKTQFPPFLVSHHAGGKPTSKRPSFWDEVEAWVEDVVAAIRKNDPERLELTGRDRQIYLAALEAEDCQ
jgi:hypothetical protein